MSNILDTRDLQERLEELESAKFAHDKANEALIDAEEAVDAFGGDIDSPELIKLEAELQAAHDAFDRVEMDSDDIHELDQLRELKEEVGDEWNHGVQLIPEDDFADYCQDLCEDIGDLPKDLPSYIVIDWDATCDNLRQDYAETEFRGETYLYRA